MQFEDRVFRLDMTREEAKHLLGLAGIGSHILVGASDEASALATMQAFRAYLTPDDFTNIANKLDLLKNEAFDDAGLQPEA